MNIWLCFGFILDVLSPLINALGVGPWLMALTLGASQLLASPACAREAVGLGRPIWKLGWLGLAYYTLLLPAFLYAGTLLPPGDSLNAAKHAAGFATPLATWPWLLSLPAGALWLAGMLALAPLRRGWTQLYPPQRALVPALLAGLLFAASRTTLNWPWQIGPDFPVNHSVLMAGAINGAWRDVLSGLGLAAALALAWRLRTGPSHADQAEKGRPPMRHPTEEALPVRWFAAVAATVFLWVEARWLWNIGATLLNRFLTHREFPDFLLPSLQPTLFSLPHLALQAFSIACWLLIAARPCRPHASNLALLAFGGLVLNWLVRQVPLMWANWQIFQASF